MRLLADTHIALWSVTESPRFTPAIRSLLHDAEEVFVSVVSVWEVAIKFARNRGTADDMPFNAHVALTEFLAVGYTMLAVKPDHVVAVDDLPRHHRDPFDRLMVAQALVEPLRLVTADKRLSAYGGQVTLV